MAGRLTIRIKKREEKAQRLEDLVLRMKEAVAMNIGIHISPSNAFLPETCRCSDWIYHANNKSISAAGKERIHLSAIRSNGKRRQQQRAILSGWELNRMLRFTRMGRSEFVFEVGTYMAQVSLVETFATDLGDVCQYYGTPIRSNV